MPTLSHGKICHIEMPATDPEAAAAFYARVFGWKVRRGGNVVGLYQEPR